MDQNIKDTTGAAITLLLVGGYLAGKITGKYDLPDSIITLLLGYYFGANYSSIKAAIVQRLGKKK